MGEGVSLSLPREGVLGAILLPAFSSLISVPFTRVHVSLCERNFYGGFLVVNHLVVSVLFSREHGFSGGSILPDIYTGVCSPMWTAEAVRSGGHGALTKRNSPRQKWGIPFGTQKENVDGGFLLPHSGVTIVGAAPPNKEVFRTSKDVYAGSTGAKCADEVTVSCMADVDAISADVADLFAAVTDCVIGDLPSDPEDAATFRSEVGDRNSASGHVAMVVPHRLLLMLPGSPLIPTETHRRPHPTRIQRKQLQCLVQIGMVGNRPGVGGICLRTACTPPGEGSVGYRFVGSGARRRGCWAWKGNGETRKGSSGQFFRYPSHGLPKWISTRCRY